MLWRARTRVAGSGSGTRDAAASGPREPPPVRVERVLPAEEGRHEIAGVITETVERWDPTETTSKIELQVGRDLQYIRINGTVVGALAGLVIHAIATGVQALA